MWWVQLVQLSGKHLPHLVQFGREDVSLYAAPGQLFQLGGEEEVLQQLLLLQQHVLIGRYLLEQRYVSRLFPCSS